MASVTEMPPVESPETPNTAPESSTPAKTPASKKPGRPPGGPEPRFFDKVANVPKSDWGTRAFMYVYADEPVCNAKTFGTTRYMLKSSAPILDLEGLKQDYGSFKGWMTLNLRKTGKDQTDEVDRFEFEIYDPKHPPKIPKSAWANDARNKKWLDLLPPEKPPVSDAATSLRDAIGVIRDIKAEVREEMPAADTSDPTRNTLETMKLAKDLFAPKETNAAGALNPLELLKAAKELATPPATDNKMLETIVTLLQGQIAAQAEELKQLRHQPAPVQKGLLEQITDLATVADKLEPVKKLLGFGSAAAETVTRSGRTSGLDVVQNLGRDFFQSDFSRDVGRWLGSLAERNMAQAQSMNPASNGQPHQPQPQQIGDPFQRFVVEIVNPKMLMFFNDEPNSEGGEAFADWLWAGFPEHFERLQNFEHPRLPGLKGAAAILTGYRNTPNIWNQVRPERESGFAEFVNAFCEWKPPGDEPAEDAEVVQPESGVVDFDAQEGRPS